MTIVLQVIQEGRPGAARDFDMDLVRVGRDPANDLVLGEAAGVSRFHAEIRHEGSTWRVIDLNSSNGTFVHGRRVTESPVGDGDEIQFAPEGPKVRVSLPTSMSGTGGGATAVSGAHQVTGATGGGGAVAASEGVPSDSELLPLRMGTAPIAAKGYLIPGLVAALTISVLLWAMQSGDIHKFQIVALGFFVSASVYVIYMLCGKSKPILPMLAGALLVGLIVANAHSVVMAPLHATILPKLSKEVPGPRPGTVRLVEPDSVPGLFAYMYFAAALPEELEKILPALIGLWLTYRIRKKGSGGPYEMQARVLEPIDGILMGVAGAAGFHFVEALSYAGRPVAEFLAYKSQAPALFVQLARKGGSADAAAAALMQIGFDQGVASMFQILFRGLRGTFGHLAYSGIFGYYVGLAALRPAHAKSLLLRGFFTATIIHACWNSTQDIGGAYVIPAIAFALLITSIIKARALSPTRAENFATTLGRAT
jgi:RsiW-degrading membrane proteinase PrsW (M82 family)